MLLERIKKLAKEKGFAIKDIEDSVGIGNGTIGKRKNSAPNAYNLQAVAEFLGVSISFLLNGIETVPLKDIEFTREEINLIHEYRKLDFKSQTAVNNKILEEVAKNNK